MADDVNKIVRESLVLASNTNDIKNITIKLTQECGKIKSVE